MSASKHDWHAQGVIKSWDVETFANTVTVDGVEFRDLPVASGVEALTYQPGDVVLVEKWFPGGRRGELGVGTAWIRGRVITLGRTRPSGRLSS